MDQHARLDLVGALDGVSGPGVVEALGFGVVEVAPAVDVDDVAGVRGVGALRFSALFVRAPGIGDLVVVIPCVVAHGPVLQQRSDQGQKRHSWKSAACAMRGSSSPASVARIIRTPLSLIRCASAPSNGTGS